MSKPSSAPDQFQNVNRREALKALAAAGGALTAAAFLPGRWTKPLVESGVLPAHAQGSVCGGSYTFVSCAISNVYWTWSNEYQVYFFLCELSAQIFPPCPDVSVCIRILGRNGEQVVFDFSIGCGYLSLEDGTVEVHLGFYSGYVGNTDRIGGVFAMEHDSTETCEFIADVLPLPERPIGANPGPSKTAPSYIIIKGKHK